MCAVNNISSLFLLDSVLYLSLYMTKTVVEYVAVNGEVEKEEKREESSELSFVIVCNHSRLTKYNMHIFSRPLIVVAF